MQGKWNMGWQKQILGGFQATLTQHVKNAQAFIIISCECILYLLLIIIISYSFSCVHMFIIKGTCRGWIEVQTETLLRVRYTSIKRWFLPHTVYFLYPVPSCDNMWLHNDIWASLVLLAQCRTPISLSSLRVCSAVNWPEGILVEAGTEAEWCGLFINIFACFHVWEHLSQKAGLNLYHSLCMLLRAGSGTETTQ